jgi:hypothetical protein
VVDQAQPQIGYDPATGTFPSTVYSNVSPAPLPYRWELDGDADEAVNVPYDIGGRRLR